MINMYYYNNNNNNNNNYVHNKSKTKTKTTTTTTAMMMSSALLKSLWLWLMLFLMLHQCPLCDLKQQQIVQQQRSPNELALTTTTTTTTNNYKPNNYELWQQNEAEEAEEAEETFLRKERAKNILENYKFSFKQSAYNVSIAENSIGKTYATVNGEDLLAIKLPIYVQQQVKQQHDNNYNYIIQCEVKFRIVNGDKDKLFKAEERIVGNFAFLTIRTRTSSIVLNREKHDHYTLRVRALANCMEYKNYETEVIINLQVLDRNDLSPLFYPTSYETVIPEDTPLHSSIIRVFAEDADIGINGEIYYSFLISNDYFAIHPTSGIITLMRPLSFNEYSRYKLVVLANDRGTAINHYSHQATKANVSIIVEQVNLFSPEIYVNTLTSFTANMSALIYGIVRVTDRDDNRHGDIHSLDIVDGNPDGRFRIRPTQIKGEYYIQINKIAKLYNHPYIYNLTLRAEDNGIPPRASYKQVPIHYVPETNTIPIFSKQIYEISIAETSPPNMPVIRLKVSDPNMANHALVYLEIVGGNEGGEFRINPETGMLYTQKLLDAENKAFYTLTVSAIDQANVQVKKK